MYDCPCGKQHRSRTTVYKHKKKLAGGEQRSNERPDEHQDEQKKNVQMNTKGIDGQSSVQEINMVEELGSKKDKVEPKEKKYKCANCGFETDERTKYCPGCGILW